MEQRKFTVNARANCEAIMKVVKYWSRGLERGWNLCPWGHSGLGQASLGAACLELARVGVGLGESSKGARALQALQEVWSWAGDRVPAGGGIPTLAAQMGQEQGGTGTAPLAPLLKPCVCLLCPCTLFSGFMLGSHGLETTLLPPAPFPPLILLQHFAPRRPSMGALCAWCLVLAASILITRTTEKANVLCRTWYKSQQYLESVESAQKMFMEAEKNIKR